MSRSPQVSLARLPALCCQPASPWIGSQLAARLPLKHANPDALCAALFPAEGQWRPDGSSLKYFNISADPASVAAALASAAAPTTAPMADAGAPGVKAEAEGAASRGHGGGSDAAAGDELVVADSEEEEEEDEAEELRQAAAAVTRTPPAPAPDAIPGQVRPPHLFAPGTLSACLPLSTSRACIQESLSCLQLSPQLCPLPFPCLPALAEAQAARD